MDLCVWCSDLLVPVSIFVLVICVFVCVALKYNVLSSTLSYFFVAEIKYVTPKANDEKLIVAHSL